MPPALSTSRHLLTAASLLLLTACSTTRPWLNDAIAPASPTPAASVFGTPATAPAHAAVPSMVSAVTLSGGGARAAAFGLGVLQELKATRFTWDGRETNLLDEIGLISGVSGGSVLATYYAAFGDEVFTRFESDFLLVNFQSGLVERALSPGTLYRLTSPWFGRSNVFAERLDKVFRGMTFGDLQKLPERPRLLVTATDLTTGAPFEFTAEQFALICSDLNSVPLSQAVAASSAVPILLSPVTLRNHAGSCPQSEQVATAAPAEGNYQAQLLHANAQSYLDVQERPFLHLVDGGLSDNLGVRGLLDRSIAGGSLDDSFKGLPAGSLRKIVLISVNSERDTAERIDRSDFVPSTGQVLDALIFGAGSRATKETLAIMSDNARRWTQELMASRGREGSPFAPDAQIHVINVSLRDVRDPELRRSLLHVPTALTILPLHVRQLQAAGRTALRESPEFQQLRQSLGLSPDQP
ncbi:patatin-like phospholipase family protein [Piscinibacter sp.]|uniref:patatin-like phospholipase family protein n=1 Tax=Piscinibacter sp. TaxID=1903157 RepID=UPI002ED42B19